MWPTITPIGGSQIGGIRKDVILRVKRRENVKRKMKSRRSAKHRVVVDQDPAGSIGNNALIFLNRWKRQCRERIYKLLPGVTCMAGVIGIRIQKTWGKTHAKRGSEYAEWENGRKSSGRGGNSEKETLVGGGEETLCHGISKKSHKLNRLRIALIEQEKKKEKNCPAELPTTKARQKEEASQNNDWLKSRLREGDGEKRETQLLKKRGKEPRKESYLLGGTQNNCWPLRPSGKPKEKINRRTELLANNWGRSLGKSADCNQVSKK